MAGVSVIIPAYNAACSVSLAIESVLGQTYKDTEIIVVDDGSSDGTAEITKKYNIKYIYQENAGPAAARNRGINEAKGDYIAFLDSDDIWLSEKLELEVKKMEEDPRNGLIHTGRVRINIDGTVLPGKRYGAPEGFVFNELLKRNFICTSSVLVKRLCFSETGLFDEDKKNKSEDYDMWLRIARKYKVGFLDRPLVKYRVNPEGYNRSNIGVAYDSEKAVFFKALEHYGGDREKLKRERINSLMRRMGDSFFDAKEYGRASQAFASALKVRAADIRSAGFYFISKFMETLKA